LFVCFLSITNSDNPNTIIFFIVERPDIICNLNIILLLSM
jgi:hypothetical protein